jgi:hypothetical protein
VDSLLPWQAHHQWDHKDQWEVADQGEVADVEVVVLRAVAHLGLALLSLV